jgi:tripartite ATP-independent transporter DctM subunit
LIPPSIAFIVYSVLVPSATVPALFAAGMIPGVLVGLALMVPTFWLARRHGMGRLEADLPRPPFLRSLREAVWGLVAPVLILGGMRAGWFTPTEAAVVAVFYGLFVGMVIHRTIQFKDLFVILRESGELSAVILIVVALAGIFAYSLSTLGVIDPITNAIVKSSLGEHGVLAMVVLLLVVAGMFLDGISIFLIFVPLLWPLVQFYHWDTVWFGVLLTLLVALGQFTPPMAVNLMVSCRIAKVGMDETVPWVLWLVGTMFLVIIAVVLWPQLALWLPTQLGY